MTRFTTDNTEGFTATDLATINSAFDRVMAMQDQGYGGDDDDDFGLTDSERAMVAKSLGDAINNAWQPGMTEAALIAALPAGWIA